MGCVASTEDSGVTFVLLSLAERKTQARAKRKEASSIAHNLVHEEFGRDITELYDLDGDILGEGLQGVVRKVTHKVTGVQYAMKTVPLGAGKDSKAMAQLRSEVDLIRKLDHPNIVRLQQIFETEDSIFLVMDLCTGGDMMTRWEHRRGLKYSEDQAAQIVRKIVNAVRYCHERRVVHRDIKLENILWANPSDEAEPQLVDFGLGVTFADDSEVFREDVGSLYYVAPEVLGRNYGKACDCWSIGVIAYMLLSGMPPFLAPTDDGIKLKIKWAKPGFPKDMWEIVSEEAIDFIKKLLVKAPGKRMTAEEASAHPWLNTRRETASGSNVKVVQDSERGYEKGEMFPASPSPTTSTDALDPDVIMRLKRFQNFGALKRVALEVIARTLSQDEIHSLRVEFQKVDVEGRGEISPLALQKALQSSGHFPTEEVSRMFDHLDVDQDGKIGFSEFLAASLSSVHVNNDNLRLAFDRLDYEQKGKVTIENLSEITGSSVNKKELEELVTDEDLREALLGDNGDSGVSYEEFKRAIVKSFTRTETDDPTSLSTMVRAASKLSIEELAKAMDGSEEEAASIITASNKILNRTSSKENMADQGVLSKPDLLRPIIV